MIQSLWKTVWKFLKKNKTKQTELAYDPAIPLLVIYSKDIKAVSRRNIYTPIFKNALFTIAKNMGIMPSTHRQTNR